LRRNEGMIEAGGHFTWEEARCACCWAIPEGVLPDLYRTASKLEVLRHRMGEPLPVSSWYRCKQHPIERGKHPNALHRHCTGRAVDIGAKGLTRLKLVELARTCSFKSVGVYHWGVHLDWVEGRVARHWLGRGYR